MGAIESTSSSNSVTTAVTGNVDDLEVQWKYGSVKIQFGKYDEITVTTNGNEVLIEENDGTLIVESNEEKPSNLALCVPEDMPIQKFVFNGGVGEAELVDVNSKFVEVYANVMDIKCSFSVVPESLLYKTGTGDACIVFPGTDSISITAPFGLGGRDIADRFIVTKDGPLHIEVSVGNLVVQ